uniref:C2H2-type domain-containing protein n=1 Tax=Cyprinus carpio TaxID=7962 RepID=A0A8C1S152_CYPCA
MTCDLECFLDHCKEFGTSQDGSTCASNHANIDTSSTSNRDENICPTIDSLSFCQLERTVPDPENTSSNPELEKTFVISGDGKCSLDDFHLDVINQNPENISSKPSFQGKIEISGHGKGALDGCLLESNQLDPKSTSSKPGFQEAIGVSGHGHNSADSCQLERNKPDPKSISSKPVHGNSSQLEGQKCFTSDDEQVERSSFGFLESCFGLKTTAQNAEELKYLEHAHVNKVNECSPFNHTEPPVLLKTAFESNNKMDEGTDALKDPPVLSTDQTSKTSLDPGQQQCLTGNSTISSKDSLSYFMTQKRKLQPVVLLKTTEKKTSLRYKCTFCPAEFSSKSGFYSHLAKHKSLGHAKKAVKHKHGNAVNLKSSSSPGQRPTSQECADDTRLPHSCRFCGRAFASPDSLKKHLQLHKGNKPFRCLDCGKNFARHGHLMAHKNVHRRNVQCSVCWERRQEFKCGLCQEAFIDSKAFSEHCLTHMPGPSASKCQFCKRHFSNRTGLIRHIRLHTGEKPFPCQTCGRHFHRKEVLKLHQGKCTVEQPPPLQTSNAKQLQAEHSIDPSKKTNKAYNCSYCPHSFRFPNNLKLHERAHLAKTVFPCSKHLSLHSKETAYACVHCGQKFDSQDRYLQHEAFCDGVCKEH